MPDEEARRRANNTIRLLLYIVLIQFVAIGLFAVGGYLVITDFKDTQTDATKCIALVEDHAADAWGKTANAFVTPAVTPGGAAAARVEAVNGIVDASHGMKVQSAKCIGAAPPPTPRTLPVPTTVP